jgi:hypothetical protein
MVYFICERGRSNTRRNHLSRHGTGGGIGLVKIGPEMNRKVAAQGKRVGRSIARTNGGIQIAWPVAAAGFALQMADQISAAPIWSALATPPVTLVGQDDVVTVPLSGAQKFFRLSKP